MSRVHADRGRRGRSFVELIFVLVVMAAAASYFVPRYFGAGGNSLRSTPDASVLTDAKDVSCRTILSVIRQAIVSKRAAGTTPRTLDDAGVAGDSKCPAGGEDYTYSPDSGTVRCPHPGHEAF
jgi:hypothetical protein